jgi:hypothetical protein
VSRASDTTLRLWALLALAIPASLLGRLLIDNLATGDPRTPGHLLIEVPLLAAMALSWRRPRLVGNLLIVVALAGMAVNPVTHMSQPLDGIVLVEVVIFGPPLLAGLVLRAAAGSNGRS